MARAMNNSTFQERKAARIAQQMADRGKRFAFRVVCTSYALPADINPVLPGLFANNSDAMRHAFEKLPMAPVGYTGAVRQMNEILLARKRIGLPDGARFDVERVEVPSV